MPSQIQDRYRRSIPAVSGLDSRDVTVPNIALQDEYAVENNRIMFPNHSRVQSGQSSSCSSDSGSVDGNESTEGDVISKLPHQSSTTVFTDQAQIPDELDMTLPFPVKLHYIVSNPRFKEYIGWCPHGRAWRVLNQQAFERDVIPIFFRSAKFTSFMRQVSKGTLPYFQIQGLILLTYNILWEIASRQVNGWAFVRIPQGPDVNCYYHEVSTTTLSSRVGRRSSHNAFTDTIVFFMAIYQMFLRGIPRLAFHMKRPPKVKNAASIARKQTGAGVGGSPDFYRISQIAPLPPVMPYKIKIKLSNLRGHDGTSDAMMAHFATRYVIEPLHVDAIEEDVDHQMLLDDPREGNLTPRSFVDTFNEGGSDNNFEPVDCAASGSEESVMEGRGRGASSSTRGSSMGPSSLDQATIGMQGLSAADISYLAHQNRTLRKHF